MPIKVEAGTKGRIDWAFLLAVGGLVIMGTLAIVSAASPVPSYLGIVRSHFMALMIGATLFNRTRLQLSIFETSPDRAWRSCCC